MEDFRLEDAEENRESGGVTFLARFSAPALLSLVVGARRGGAGGPALGFFKVFLLYEVDCSETGDWVMEGVGL